MASTSQVILITGANRSLGFSILKVTALRLPNATYLLGCRSLEAGHEAAKEFKKLGVAAQIEPIQLDITEDNSIQAAVETVKTKYGRLDVLVNNAGIALSPPDESLSSLRATYNAVFNTNVTSMAVTTAAFLPLLHAAKSPILIQVSSKRGSIGLTLSGALPPIKSTAYNISKTAVSMVVIGEELAEALREQEAGAGGLEGRVRVYGVCPGHLKTAFNGFRGMRDPDSGAEVVTRLIVAEEGDYKGGSFWEFEEGRMREVPW